MNGDHLWNIRQTELYNLPRLEQGGLRPSSMRNRLWSSLCVRRYEIVRYEPGGCLYGFKRRCNYGLVSAERGGFVYRAYFLQRFRSDLCFALASAVVCHCML
jgi:hypothetical protein